MSRNCLRIASVLGSLAVALAVPAVALANTGFYVMADRSSVVQGISTAVVLRIGPDDQDDVDNRCYAITLPAAFAVQGASITANPEGNWSADVQGNRVRLRSNGDSVIEDDEQLGGAITVTGVTPGSYAWTVGGYDNNGCAGGPGEQRSVAMAITPAGPAPTPPPPPPPPPPSPPSTPAPTPPPPPTSTPAPAPPRPSATAQPTPPAGNAGPPAPPSVEDGTPPPSSGSAPPASGVTPTDSAAPSSSAAATASPLPGSDARTPTQLDTVLGPGTAATPNQRSIPALSVAPSEGTHAAAALEEQLNAGVLSAMSMMQNPLEWFVPGLTVGVPGMLILAVLGAQVLGGFVWIPAVRRTLRDERNRRRPLRPAWL